MADSDKVIVYTTDNSLEEGLAQRCREVLVQAAGGRRIVSVSQKPLDFGENICVGEIGRSWTNLYAQLSAGLEAVTTPWVCVVEHDCMYTPEHFAWTPPRDDTLYYNTNLWFVQWGWRRPELRGMYSRTHDRAVLSALVGNRTVVQDYVQDQLSRCLDGKEMLGDRARGYKSEVFETELPNLDIRHGTNWSGWRRAHNRCWELPYWGKFADVMEGRSP